MFGSLKWRWVGLAPTVVLLLLLAFLGRAFVEARALPIVRRASLALPDWPAGEPSAKVVLLSDLHVGNLATDPARLTTVVSDVDALHPDLILIAGDFVPGRKSIAPQEIQRRLLPLARLTAPLGVLAVLGNHDYWVGAAPIRSALAKAGVTLLSNQAVQRGPLVIGGVDDPVTNHSDLPSLTRAMQALPGARIVLAHSPEVEDELPPGLTLLLAGHTHCGQVRLPLIDPQGPRWPYSRYECGLVRDPNLTTVVTAGVGTSMVPLRVGAPPDLWLLTLGPVASPRQ